MAVIPIPEGSYKNVPENSFGSADIFRILANHCVKMERAHLLYFYLVVIPASGLITDLIGVITLLFKPTIIIMRILKLFRAWDYIVQRFNPLDPALLLMVLPYEVRKEAMKLLEVLTDEYYLEA